MEFDPQVFAVQVLASLLGSLLGVTAGAWLTGFFQIKGEITGRAEKIDAILNEVRQTVKATEGMKIETRLEKLDQILPEVRAVTEAQERIEATITGGEWDRQWRLNQRLEAYGRLLVAVAGVRDYYLAVARFQGEGIGEQVLQEDFGVYRKHAADFVTATALVHIFAKPESAAIAALNIYNGRLRERGGGPQMIAALEELQIELISAAREDLNVQ